MHLQCIFPAFLFICKFETLQFVPVAAGEVGHSDRHAVVLGRCCRQLADARPLGSVVYILIERQTVLQTVYQTIVHHEVHTAVTAYLLGLLLYFAVDGMLVSLIRAARTSFETKL